jgi:glycosyltransferase involved in cell wall biosynthesis
MSAVATRDDSSGKVRPGILVLSSTYPRWAADPEPGFVHELCKRLTGDFEVLVVTPSAPGAASFERLDGVEVYRYRYAPMSWQTLVHGGGIVTNLRRHPIKVLLLPGFMLGLWSAARRLIRRRRIDAIHAHWMIPQGIMAAALGRPLLVTAHGADVFALRGRAFDYVRRIVLRKATHITVVSADMARALNAPPGVRLDVLPMGIDLGRFKESDAPRESRLLLFVGRLVEKKGLRYLLDAMPAILRQEPDVHVWIAGFGPELSQLRMQCERLGIVERVRFLGAVAQEDLPALYRRATLFVAPFVEASNGDREGLGLVVAEAMACGCPVIAGNVGGVLDLLGAGTHASVVNANIPDELAAEVCALLADPSRRQAMAAQAGRFVRARFGWDAIADGYGRILREAVATSAQHLS